jgi:hypothetical protein
MSDPFEVIRDQLEQLEQPRRRFPCPRPLVFLHLPKAGGSTLQEVIVRQYMCGFGFRFTGDRAQLRAFKALPEESRAKFDLVHGHVHFGIHQWLPDPATYITMLRDPVDRVISHYYFILNHPSHYIYPVIKERGLSLKDYGTLKPTHETDNDMTRWLTPREHNEVRLGQVTRSMVEEAKWNLANAFSCFGLVERFDESLACFQAAFGWKDVSYRERKNVNPDRPPLEEIPRETIDAIREANAFDVELFEFAKALFGEQLLRLGVPSRAPVDPPQETPPGGRKELAAAIA